MVPGRRAPLKRSRTHGSRPGDPRNSDLKTSNVKLTTSPYVSVSRILGENFALAGKNLLQKAYERYLAAKGFKFRDLDALIRPHGESVLFIVAPGVSLNDLTLDQVSEIQANTSIGISWTILAPVELTTYVSETFALANDCFDIALSRNNGSSLNVFGPPEELSDTITTRLRRTFHKPTPYSIRSTGQDFKQYFAQRDIVPSVCRLRFSPVGSKQSLQTWLKRRSRICGRASTFTQVVSTLPSTVVTGCLLGFKNIVLVGCDLTTEYFLPEITRKYQKAVEDLQPSLRHPMEQGRHITASTSYSDQWQTTPDLLRLIVEVFPNVSIRRGTESSDLSFLPTYNWGRV